ncbi:glycoside hydrolase family 65 protein [Streptomyces hoynatensis]|uniref:Glycoside hydrolase family 65 protein n=1 Tax=Streptomyces hoynatensis TaxID=1141874 RepID=A0A3A9YXW4_9ACTN|nr:glycosyl hydrolase family 65 protein [Streptomyces hoynatensis]RKN40077.1 glycoside hydrolase family 65 protein [Streptomyces hoynatensis]
MISHPQYLTEPWALRESGLDLDVLPQSESLFALSNGHLGWRGNLDEGEPGALPGSYLGGVHELRALPYAEARYGSPETGQTLVDVTNGKLVRLLVDDEPFDIRLGRLHRHERTLDLRAGLLRRTADWTSPAGTRVLVRSTRLVSLGQRAIGAVSFEVEPVDAEARVVVQSELLANEPLPPQDGSDPRSGALIPDPLLALRHDADGGRLRLIHRTRRSALTVAAACGHEVTGPAGTRSHAEAEPDLARFTTVARLRRGERLRVRKTVAHAWSATRSCAGLRAEVDAALAAAEATGWEGLLAEQRACLDAFWERADVRLTGADELQHAVRYALFQAAVRTEEQPISVKGLTGVGYEGHCMWDTETFVLPVLTYTCPEAAAQELRWRHRTLPQAIERARQFGLRGAAFPWRTIAGQESSAYWPAGTAAFHVNAAIAEAAERYTACTGDTEFEREAGVELLVGTARLWESLGHTGPDGAFHLDGVTGPDEYSAVADDNVYTNLMARANLGAAAEAADRHPDLARGLDVRPEEIARWRSAADRMALPYNAELGVHEQSAGFTRHQRWDFAHTGPEEYPLMLHHPYFDLYRKQVVKQADLVLALFLRGEAFTEQEKARDFAYYEPLTVRDSSLSACCQAIVAAETGHLGLAVDHLFESAAIDLEDLEKNTRDGLHLASLAGVWLALVAGFGGLRRRGRELHFAPRLAEPLTELGFRLSAFGRRITVDLTPDAATYTLVAGQALGIRHHGKPLTLEPGTPVTREIPQQPPRPAPGAPRGREPRRALR